MRTPKNIILNEENYYEYTIGSFDDITINIQCYNPIYGIDPYLKVYKNIYNPKKQRFCRLSLIEPKYLCLYDETLCLSQKDIENVDHIIKYAGINQISESNVSEESGWNNILHRFVSIISEEQCYLDDTYNDDMINDGYIINDIDADSIGKIDYYKLLENTIQTNIINSQYNSYRSQIYNYYTWLSNQDNLEIYRDDDEHTIFTVDLSIVYPNIKVSDVGIINLNTFESNFDKESTEYIVENEFINEPSKDILRNGFYRFLQFDVYETAILLYHSKKGMTFDDIDFSNRIKY